MNIFVGNIDWKMSDEDLRSAFEVHGTVDSAKVIMDRETGRSRGFGFVEMSNDGDARRAIDQMNDKEVRGRTLKVNEARPREDRRANAR